jgi:hypothetical protein
VLAPSRISPDVTFTNNARITAIGSTPKWLSKRRSSTAFSVSVKSGGMSSGATMRRSSPCDGNKLPIRSGFKRTMAARPPLESRSARDAAADERDGDELLGLDVARDRKTARRNIQPSHADAVLAGADEAAGPRGSRGA